MSDLTHCPKCGGPADNGHDRSIPPNPYFCTKCMAEPKQDGCDHCNHPLYAAVKCRVCGRVTEPVQEPYAWMSVGGSIWRHKTTEDDVPLYTAPRKPLAEWQINDLMSDIDPEDRDSWSFRQGVYAAEKHHGVRR